MTLEGKSIVSKLVQKGRVAVHGFDRFVQNHPTTIALVFLLFFWYVFQLVVTLYFDFGAEQVRFWFKMSFVDGLTPGWIFSTVSHSYSPIFTHTSANILGLLVFGAAIERHISWRQYLLVFFGVGFLSQFTYVLYWWSVGQSSSVMGASGAVIGLTLLYATHFARHHDHAGTMDGSEGVYETVLKTARSPFVLAVVSLAIIGYTTAQLLGYVPAGDTAVIGHLSGAILGIGSEYLISTENGRPVICEWEPRTSSR